MMMMTTIMVLTMMIIMETAGLYSTAAGVIDWKHLDLTNQDHDEWNDFRALAELRKRRSRCLS